MKKIKVNIRPAIFLAITMVCAVFSRCSNEVKTKKSVTQIVSGNDTILVIHTPNEELNFDVSKANSTSGHNDTTTGITTIKFCNSFRKDSVIRDSMFINSGNGSQHNNTGSGTQVINNQ